MPIRRLIILVLISILMVFPSYVFCEEYKSTIDYIKETNKLVGISACIINNEDGSITLVRRKLCGYNLYTLDRMGDYIEPLEKVRLKPGQSCRLVERHACLTYKFIGLKDGKIAIEVTDKFDARSFGGKVKQERKALMIIPYEDNQ